MTKNTTGDDVPSDVRSVPEEADGTANGGPAAATVTGGGAPDVPEEIRAAARLAPDHWFGMADPAWSGEGEPPEWALVGRWRSGPDGEIAAWQDNPEYRPSPSALGWPEPADEVDRAVQLAATGYGSGDAVAASLADREVAVYAAPGGGPLTALTPDGAVAVPVFTSPGHLHAAGRLAFELVNTGELVDLVPPQQLLYLNPSGPVSMTLEPAAVRNAARTEPASDAAAPDGTASSVSAPDEPAAAARTAGDARTPEPMRRETPE